jgi:peroxiredoxin
MPAEVVMMRGGYVPIGLLLFSALWTCCSTPLIAQQTPSGKELMTQVLEAYAGAETIHASGSVTVSSLPGPETLWTTPFEIWWQKPNLLRMASFASRAVSDGERLYRSSAGDDNVFWWQPALVVPPSLWGWFLTIGPVPWFVGYEDALWRAPGDSGFRFDSTWTFVESVARAEGGFLVRATWAVEPGYVCSLEWGVALDPLRVTSQKTMMPSPEEFLPPAQCEVSWQNVSFNEAPPEGTFVFRLPKVRKLFEVARAEEWGSQGQELAGKEAPDFTLTSLAGEQVTLSQFRGQTVLLNFWDRGWAPRWSESEALHKEYGGRGLKVLAVAVSLSDSDEEISGLASEEGVTFTILQDAEGKAEAVSDQYRVYAIPTTFAINAQGTIVKALVGVQTKEALLAAAKEAGLAAD